MIYLLLYFVGYLISTVTGLIEHPPKNRFEFNQYLLHSFLYPIIVPVWAYLRITDFIYKKMYPNNTDNKS